MYPLNTVELHQILRQYYDTNPPGFCRTPPVIRLKSSGVIHIEFPTNAFGIVIECEISEDADLMTPESPHWAIVYRGRSCGVLKTWISFDEIVRGGGIEHLARLIQTNVASLVSSDWR